jgi:hypothetical protein
MRMREEILAADEVLTIHACGVGQRTSATEWGGTLSRDKASGRR